MRLRMWAGGVTAIAAAGLVLGTGAPANAQDSEADVSIGLVGTTIAGGVSGKFGTLTLGNHGPADAVGVEFVYDLTALDTSKVEILLADCAPDGSGIAVCIIDPDGLANGQHVNFVDFLQVVPGATGDAGAITMSISHAGTDPNPANNTTTVPVSIGGSGPDLLVIAPDIHNEANVDLDNLNLTEVLDTPVIPGSDALVAVFVANQGTDPTSGVQMSISLPEHVSFTLPEPECSHAAGASTTTCDYATVAFSPGYDPVPDSETYCAASMTCGWFVFPVAVAEDAPHPAPLTGGLAEAWDMQAVQLFAAAELPENFTTDDPVDVDPSDNNSEFTVFVSSPPEEPGGGGGELPVTGAPAALLGGVGLAALAAGAVAFVLARRRRVVLATPDIDG